MNEPKGHLLDNPPTLAFVCPRLHEPGTVGGAETLMYSLARDAASAGCKVHFLTTCARNHFTWENELPAESFERDGVHIQRFPVDEERDSRLFGELQAALSRNERFSSAQEDAWLEHGVNSAALIETLTRKQDSFDRIIAGPYLFSLVVAATAVAPGKTLLIPCLHDEPFARVRRIERMFRSVRGCLFNTAPERDLAERLYPGLAPGVNAIVAMGIEPFEVEKGDSPRKPDLRAPYIIYSGRREPLKGTPLLIDYLEAFRQRNPDLDIGLVLTGSGAVDIPPSLRDRVMDLGFVSEEDKRRAMAGALAFCHPSVNESLSIVLIESWLAGTPALVHAGGDVLPWQCRMSNGGLWFRNYPEFEESLLFLASSPGARARMARNGREYAIRTYAPEAVLQRFLGAIRQ